MSWVEALLVAALLSAAAALVVWRERVKGGTVAFVAFVREAKGEVEKITWPDKLQLRNATLVILAFVTLVALVIGAMDVVLQWLVVGLPGKLS